MEFLVHWLGPPPGPPVVVPSDTRQIDPTRPVLDSSGYFHGLPDPQLLDTHDYDQNPETFGKRYANILTGAALPPQYGQGGTSAFVPYFVSEYGGIGYNPRHGEEAWGYGQWAHSAEELVSRYRALTETLLGNPRMFGFCYTQLYDIEQEQNGLYTYAREPKVDPELIRAINEQPAASEG